MRYPASEKLEIIRTVKASHLPTRQNLKMLEIPSSTYYDRPGGATVAPMSWLIVPHGPSQFGTASQTRYARMLSILPLSMKF